MTKHHLQMVAFGFLLACGLTACGSGGSSLPGTMSNTVSAIPSMGLTTDATAGRLTAANTINAAPAAASATIAIDAGSSVAVGSWLADKDYTFTGWGEPATYTSPINTSLVANAPPQSVYQTDRWAPTLTYTIPNLTPNASYTVRLHFAECWFTSAGQRLFNVSINGAQVLTNFDVFQAAGGENIAIAKSFVSTADATGNITIFMSATVNNALISGIEITGASTTATPPPSSAGIAISVGNPVKSGNWLADTDYSFVGWSKAGSDTTKINTSLVSSPAPQSVYQSHRWAPTLIYTIPKLTPSAVYTVRLSFVESFFSTKAARLFNVKINGAQVLTNFDIFQAAGGGNIAVVKSFSSAADTTGKMTVQLSATLNNALLSGLEIIGASSAPSPTPAPIPSPTTAPTPVGSASYPNAGWLPYSKGPMVTTVASMYGSSPLTSCKLSGGVGGSCLASTSSGTISNLWGNNPNLFNTLYMTLGGSSVYRSHYNGGGNTVPPYFQSSSSDPQYTVQRCSQYPTTCDTGTVHIPAGAVPETGYDHHLYIHDTSTNQDWSNWGSPIPSGSGGNYQANTSNAETAGSSTYANEGLGLSGTAGNISLAWGERAQDVLAGRIPHALSLRVTCDTTTGNGWGSYVYPVVAGTTSNNATDNGNFCGQWSEQFTPGTGSSVNLEYGAHLWLDTAPASSQQGQSGCDIVAYAELRALNEFGGYANDVGSASSFGGAPIFVNRFADISDTYDGNPHGTTSYWAQVASRIGQSSSSGSSWAYNVSTCGINLAQHLHVLVPPTAN
jgi:hypothetical protein